MAEGGGRFDEPGFRVPVTEFTETWYPDVDTALRTVQGSFRRRRRRASWYEVGGRGTEGRKAPARKRNQGTSAVRQSGPGRQVLFRHIAEIVQITQAAVFERKGKKYIRLW